MLGVQSKPTVDSLTVSDVIIGTAELFLVVLLGKVEHVLF